jgi:sec-independent protein translocase protein TatA
MHFSIWELMLILVIVLVLFGGSRLRNLGSDLGSAIRGFRDSMKEGGKPEAAAAAEEDPKKLEQEAATQERTGEAATAAGDPLARDREKV